MSSSLAMVSESSTWTALSILWFPPIAPAPNLEAALVKGVIYTGILVVFAQHAEYIVKYTNIYQRIRFYNGNYTPIKVSVRNTETTMLDRSKSTIWRLSPIGAAARAVAACVVGLIG